MTLEQPSSARKSRRSCTECCRRKVRCDKNYPCDNCKRHESTCVFPKFRKAPTARREVVSQDAGRDVSQIAAPDLRPHRRSLTSMLPSSQHTYRAATATKESAAVLERRTSQTILANGPSPASTETQHASSPQLVLDRNRSRYIGNQFWTSMSHEVEEMHDVLDNSSPEPETGSEREAADERVRALRSSESFMFGPLREVNTSLKGMYPSFQCLLSMFDIFRENIDPVARIVHIPSLQASLQAGLSEGQNSLQFDKSTETLVFALCFAAVASLDEATSRRIFGEDQDSLLRRYRYATEQSLARAGFVVSQSLTVLSALVLFLLCVRRHDHSRFMSGMLGIAIRNAQAAGLHRDGLRFNISPFEVELRRRLWWHICILDLRSSEDHGCDPTIFEYNYDTEFPLNINDEDISREHSQSPQQRPGYSDMTFCLLRFEMTIHIKKLHYHPAGAPENDKPSPEDNQRYVKGVEQLFQQRYVQHCDIMSSIQWVSATWAQLMLAKLWLAVSTSSQRGSGETVPFNSRKLAFEKSMDVLRLTDTLETSPRAAKWRWLFLTHTQWHAVVYVLAYLCVHTDDLRWQAAWDLVEIVSQRWSANLHAKDGMLWGPVKRLKDRASRTRAEATGLPVSGPQRNPSHQQRSSISYSMHRPSVSSDMPTLSSVCTNETDNINTLTSPAFTDSLIADDNLPAKGVARYESRNQSMNNNSSADFHGPLSVSDGYSAPDPTFEYIMRQFETDLEAICQPDAVDFVDNGQWRTRNVWDTI